MHTSLGAHARCPAGVHRSESRQSGAGGAGTHAVQMPVSAMVAHDAPACAQVLSLRQ